MTSRTKRNITEVTGLKDGEEQRLIEMAEAFYEPQGNENDLINSQDDESTDTLADTIANMRPFRYRPNATAKDILARTAQATGLSYQDIVSVALFALQGAPQGVIAGSIAALNASIADEMFRALK